MDRTSTPAGRLASRGFGDPQAAAGVIEDWLPYVHGDEARLAPLVDTILGSADPDLALSGVRRLFHDHPPTWLRLVDEAGLRDRAVGVMGASVALNQELALRPDFVDALASEPRRRTLDELRRELLDAVRADPDAALAVGDPARADHLRLANRRALVRIAARDLASAEPTAIVDDIAGELADLADATVIAGLALARAEVDDWQRARVAVIALGKTGAGELNYISDVDVLYIAEPAEEDGVPLATPAEAVAIASRLVGVLSRITSAHTACGTIWQLDANLRPEGKHGPLVRSLASHAAYYEKWAKNWEFQAMLKARPMAGDAALADAFVDMVWGHVWNVAGNDTFVSECQAMRKRVISLIPPREADREIKLGAGGLRDTEFSVQLLQLVHGRGDERVRLRGTFDGLLALIRHGYVGRADGAELDAAYRFQRVLEHRVQLQRLRRTHLVPAEASDLRRIARSLGMKQPDQVLEQWRASARRVLSLHQRLFYSPLLEAVARIPTEAVRLTSYGATLRLEALGYRDAKGALKTLEALTQGVTRQAEIQRQLLPALLGWFAEGPNADHGLLAFRQVSEALGSSSWYLRALRDEGVMAERLARVLASSRYAVDLLLRAPQGVQMLADADSLEARPADAILAEMRSTAKRHEEPEKAVEAIRAVRRRELLRLAMADVLKRPPAHVLGEALAAVMSGTIDATFEVVARAVDSPPRLAVIAMGRWGGREISFGSDADAMVVMADTDDPDALRKATGMTSEVRRLLRLPGPDPILEIDLDLRPEGKGGPIVRSLASYKAYYERWSSTWEAQALLRASTGAGDRELAADFLTAIDPRRYAADGLQPKQLTEIRKLKARMEAERLPRGTDPRRHVKLGPGGLSDVEWTVQILQMEHARAHPELRTTRTLAALDAALEAELLTETDADALRQAWLMASEIRDAVMLLRGRASDVIPSDVRELAPIAELMGYPKGRSSTMAEEYAKRSRRARLVMDRLFWGLSAP